MECPDERRPQRGSLPVSSGMTSGLTRRNAARDAIKNLKEVDQEGLSKALTFCLMFDEPRTQFVSATMLELLTQLETALRLPTQPFLAAIRVQWWVDAVLRPVESNIAPPAPLIGQIRQLIKDNPELEGALSSLMAFWQAACYDSDRDSLAGWVTSFELLARITGQPITTKIAATVATSLYHVSHDLPPMMIPLSFIRDLQQSGKKTGQSWLYLSAMLARYLNQTDGNEAHHWLAWRVMGWRFLGPPHG